MYRSVTTVGDDEIPYYGVVETSDGQLIRFTSFEPEHFDAAMAALDDRWIELGGPAEKLRLFRRYRATADAGDALGFRALLTDDFVALDHRPIGMGVRIADEYVTSQIGLQGDRVMLYMASSVADSESAWLGRYRRHSADADWGEFVSIVKFRGELITASRTTRSTVSMTL